LRVLVSMNFDEINRIKTLAIISLFSDDNLMERITFKGGSALELIYHIIDRSSHDIDFSMEDGFNKEELESVKEKVEILFKDTFNEQGSIVFDFMFSEVPSNISEEKADFWGGYNIEFKIIEKEKANNLGNDLDAWRRQATEVGPESQRKININISKNEYCHIRIMRTLYDFTIYVYPLNVIALEKIRAICQQNDEYRKIVGKNKASRARDFFDIYTIIKQKEIDLTTVDNCKLLKKIFDVKKVPFDLLIKIEQDREHHSESFPTLKNTINPKIKIHNFDFYFDYVVKLCSKLHSLGEV